MRKTNMRFTLIELLVDTAITANTVSNSISKNAD